MRRLATVLLACSLLALAPAADRPLAAQARDTTLLGPGRADLLTGLYVLDDGRLVHVMDVRDQLRNEPTMSATEYASGRARALFPRDGAFVAGNAWFRWDSVAYRVRFEDTAGGQVQTLRWEEGGRVLAGRRAPLREREVTITSGDVRLAGVLVLPPGPGPHPAMVMVPGSGPETRRIPRQFGDLVAYRGVAVLVTDKRGTGGSTGDWNGLAHAEWASDVEAQLDFLRAQPEIDPTRIGLMGNSEGGYVAPVVAALRPDVRFLVCRVCAALPHASVIPDIETTSRRARGMPEADVARVRELLERMIRFAVHRTGYDSLVALAASGGGQSWRESVPLREIPPADAPYWDVYRGVLTVDPMVHYASLRVPTLVVLGARDDRVLVDRHRPLFESLAARPAFTLWVVPEASHGLMLGPNNSLGYPSGLYDRMADWIVRAARRGSDLQGG